MKTLRESDIEKHLIKEVKRYGGTTRKLKYLAHDGAPDRLVFLNGRIAFVELKAPGKVPRDNQYSELALLAAHGQVATYADSIETVDRIIRKMLK